MADVRASGKVLKPSQWARVAVYSYGDSGTIHTQGVQRVHSPDIQVDPGSFPNATRNRSSEGWFHTSS